MTAGILGIVLFSGCEPQNSRGYIPYVPGEGFSETMQVWIEGVDSGPVAVGEWLTAHAARQSGPWELRDSAATGVPPCQKITPVVREFEAASKVEWRADPAGSVSYNVPGPPEFKRQLRFTRPGTYRVWAVSEGCERPFESNRVEIVVE